MDIVFVLLPAIILLNAACLGSVLHTLWIHRLSRPVLLDLPE